MCLGFNTNILNQVFFQESPDVLASGQKVMGIGTSKCLAIVCPVLLPHLHLWVSRTVSPAVSAVKWKTDWNYCRDSFTGDFLIFY